MSKFNLYKGGSRQISDNRPRLTSTIFLSPSTASTPRTARLRNRIFCISSRNSSSTYLSGGGDMARVIRYHRYHEHGHTPHRNPLHLRVPLKRGLLFGHLRAPKIFLNVITACHGASRHRGDGAIQHRQRHVGA